MNLRETIVLDAASVRETQDGYLVANARVARTGIQIYRGAELGKPSLDTVRVYRPEEEVFHADAMASIAHRPITLDHPPEMVDASNWRKYSVGLTGGAVARDGDYIRVDLALMDADAIRDVRDGKRELSCGYTSDLDWTPGTSPRGEAYDALQRNIRVNHTACCDAARGGPALRIPIGDSSMTTKTIIVDGVPVEVTDVSAAVIQRALATKDAEIKRLGDELEEEAAAKKKAEEEDKKSKDSVAAKDAEIVTLKTQLADATNPQKIEQAAKDRAEVIGKARAVVGDALVVDGKSVSEIRRQVVDANPALKDVAKNWTDAEIKASFDSLTAGVQATDALATALSQPHSGGGDLRDKAYNGYVQSLNDAWKPKATA